MYHVTLLRSDHHDILVRSSREGQTGEASAECGGGGVFFPERAEGAGHIADISIIGWLT